MEGDRSVSVKHTRHRSGIYEHEDQMVGWKEIDQSA